MRVSPGSNYLLNRVGRQIALKAFAILAFATSQGQAIRDSVIGLPPVIVQGAAGEQDGIASPSIFLIPDSVIPEGLSDISSRVANFNVSEAGARGFNESHALRGLASTPLFGGSAVAYYIDDIPAGPAVVMPSEMIGITSAVIQRGPSSGTSLGGAGYAGTVFFKSASASIQQAREVRAGFGSFDARGVLATLGLREPQFSLQATAAWNQRDGYVENTRLGKQVGGQESSAMRISGQVRASESLSVGYIVSGFSARDGEQPMVPLGGSMHAIDRQFEGKTHLDAVNAGVKVVANLPAGELQAIASGYHWTLDPYTNAQAFGPLELINDGTQRWDAWTGEIRYSANPSPGVVVKIGVYSSETKVIGAFIRKFGIFPIEQSRYELQQRDQVAFGEFGFPAGDNSTVIIGARLDRARRGITRNQSVPGTARYQMAETTAAASPRVAYQLKLSERTRVELSGGLGRKPGGYSAFTGRAELAAFAPENLRSLEVSLHHSPANGRFTMTARGFHYRVRDLQIERSFATGGSADDYLVINAPRAVSTGAELESSVDFTRDWSAVASFGVTDCRLREFVDPFTKTSYAGRRTPYVPASGISLRILRTPLQGWILGLETNLKGRVYFTEDNDLLYAQRAHVIANVRAGFKGKTHQVTLHLRNLTNTAYFKSISPGVAHGVPGMGRSFSFEFALKW